MKEQDSFHTFGFGRPRLVDSGSNVAFSIEEKGEAPSDRGKEEWACGLLSLSFWREHCGAAKGGSRNGMKKVVSPAFLRFEKGYGARTLEKEGRLSSTWSAVLSSRIEGSLLCFTHGQL